MVYSTQSSVVLYCNRELLDNSRTLIFFGPSHRFRSIFTIAVRSFKRNSTQCVRVTYTLSLGFFLGHCCCSNVRVDLFTDSVVPIIVTGLASHNIEIIRKNRSSRRDRVKQRLKNRGSGRDRVKQRLKPSGLLK